MAKLVAPIREGRGSERASEATLAKFAAALESRFGFTRSEAIVAALLTEGLAYSEVAAKLGVSHNTVHTHVNALHKKAAVHTTGRLTALIRDTEKRKAGHAAPGSHHSR